MLLGAMAVAVAERLLHLPVLSHSHLQNCQFEVVWPAALVVDLDHHHHLPLNLHRQRRLITVV